MPLVQKRKKLNDYKFCDDTIYYGNEIREYVCSLVPKPALLGLTSRYSGPYWSPRLLEQDKFIYVYHVEKRRPRWIQVNRNKIVDGRRTTVSERKNLKQWRVRLFRFPVEIVESVRQHARHFTIELK